MVRSRRIVRKLKRNGNVVFAFVVGIAIGILIVSSLPNSTSTSLKATQLTSPITKNESVVSKLSGEYIFTHICMKCHIAPTKYKSFTTYFGKPASVWKIGVNKMVSAGNVRLTPEEVEEVANYLASQFGGGK